MFADHALRPLEVPLQGALSGIRIAAAPYVIQLPVRARAIIDRAHSGDRKPPIALSAVPELRHEALDQARAARSVQREMEGRVGLARAFDVAGAQLSGIPIERSLSDRVVARRTPRHGF